MDRKTLQSKITAVPQVIKDWFGSEACVNAVGKVNNQFNMIGENRRIIPRLLLRLEVKDMTPEYFAGTLALALNTDKNRAMVIVGEIKKSILAPVEKDFTAYGVDLSLLDKFEIPIGKTSTSAPKILQEIRPAVKTPVAAPTPLPSFSSTAPTAAAAPAILPPTPKQEPMKPVVEKTIPSPGKPTPAPAPKPVFLQTESISRPIPNAPNFRVPTIAEDIMIGKKKSEPLPVGSAIVEFGGAVIPQKSAPQSSGVPKITVVRYGNEKSAPPIMPPMPEPARTITEITPETLKTVVPMPKISETQPFAPLSQIPVPSSSASKPVISKPPVPTVLSQPNGAVMPQPAFPPAPQVPKPANQPEKIVQKDYSE